MSDGFTRTVARYTPHFLIIFFIAAVVATVAANGPIIETIFYGSWLLVAAALMTRLDVFLETRR